MITKLTTDLYVEILEQRVATLINEVLALKGEVERLKRENEALARRSEDERQDHD